MNVPDAYNILCKASINNRTWPKYAWILHTHQMEDFQYHSKLMVNHTITCNVEEMLDGVIFIRETFNQQVRSSTHNLNPYAGVLHDAVMITAFALNFNTTSKEDADIESRLLDLDYSSVNGHIKFNKIRPETASEWPFTK